MDPRTEAIYTLVGYVGATAIALLLVQWLAARALIWIKARNVEHLENDENIQKVTKSEEVLSYAISVNTSLSCLDADLVQMASPQNRHHCELG